MGFRLDRTLAPYDEVRRRAGELRAGDGADGRARADGWPESTGWTAGGRSRGSEGTDCSACSTADSPMKLWISFSRSSLNRACSAI